MIFVTSQEPDYDNPWQTEAPSYFVFGGLVFQRLTLDYMATWSDWWEKEPAEFLHLFYSGVCTQKQQEIVILGQILGDEINEGYQRFHDEVVASVNGTIPRNLPHFVEILEDGHRSVEIRMSSGGVIVFDSGAVKKANARIMKKYQIPAVKRMETLTPKLIGRGVSL